MVKHRVLTAVQEWNLTGLAKLGPDSKPDDL